METLLDGKANTDLIHWTFLAETPFLYQEIQYKVQRASNVEMQSHLSQVEILHCHYSERWPLSSV